MATARYGSNAFADSGALPVSLRALLRAGGEDKRGPKPNVAAKRASLGVSSSMADPSPTA
jgi:hypothetical protein